MSGRFTVETVFKGNDQTSGVLSSIQAKTKAFKSALSGPVGIADKGIDGFKKAGAVAAAAGLAAGVAFHHMVETGADFEQSITNVGAVMGKSRGQIAELEKAALSLGVSTQFSSSEVSEAMEQMARKGFDSEEILAGIPGVLNAIAASGEGMAEVATVVGSSIRGFGLEARDASHVADVLAFSAEKTGAHITDMGSALATVAPTARALGVSIEDAAASVGLLQKMGIDASTAGSATATMLAKISHPSKEAAQKMTAMGVAFKDAHGNMLPFRDVLGQFVKAGDKAGGNMDRMSFFAELVGLRGDKAALALSDMAKSGDFDKLVSGLKSVDGYSEKVAKIRMDTTKGSWKLLTSTVEVLETKLFDLNGGGFKNAIDNVNKWVSANQDLIISDVAGYATKLTDGVKDLSKHINEGVIVVGLFKDGLENAFNHSASVAVFGTALEAVFGGKDSEGPGKKAYDLGHGIGYAVDKFILFTGVVKTAQAAVWVFSNAAKVAQAATWLWEAATGTAALTTGVMAAAQVGGTGTTVAFGAAMTTASLGADALVVSEEAAAVAAFELEAASIGAEAGIAGIGAAAGVALAPIAAAAAALAGIAAAAYEAKQFMNENGGSSGAWSGLKGVFGVGTEDWGLEGMKQGVDSEMNRQARKAADERAVDGTDLAGPGARGPLGALPYKGAVAPLPFGPPRAPSSEAPAYVSPYAAPQVATRDDKSTELINTNKQLQQMIQQLTGKIGAGGGTLKITLPKGATGEVSGAPGVEVMQSGGF